MAWSQGGWVLTVAVQKLVVCYKFTHTHGAEVGGVLQVHTCTHMDTDTYSLLTAVHTVQLLPPHTHTHTHTVLDPGPRLSHVSNCKHNLQKSEGTEMSTSIVKNVDPHMYKQMFRCSSSSKQLALELIVTFIRPP